MRYVSDLVGNPTQQLWTWGSGALIGSAVVLLLAWVLWRICESRLSPRFGFWLFFLVLLKPFVQVELPVPGYLAAWIPGSTPETVVVSRDLSAVRDTASQRFIHSESAATDSFSAMPLGNTNLQTGTGKILRASRNPTASEDSPHSSKLESDSGMIRGASAWPWKELVGVAYCLSVVLLLFRFLYQQLQWKRGMLAARVIGTTELNIELSPLLQITKIRDAIQVVELDGITSPAITGTRRPVLVLPAQLWRTLSTEQLKWIILHELAHVYRKDSVIQIFQRCLLILQFWNPVAWGAYYFMNRCREDDCDDLALHWSEQNTLSAGEAFMSVVKYAAEASWPVEANSSGAIALFSSSSASNRGCRRRLKRLLDDGRKLRVKHGWKSYGLLAFAWIALLPNIRLVAVAQEKLQAKSAATISGSSSGVFELRVVAPNGQAVPHADVAIRSSPKQEWVVLAGEQFDAPNSRIARTDEDGVLRVQFSGKERNSVSFSIFSAGFAPYWANWSMQERNESLPESYTAVLDAGISIGGVIVDEAGNAIENAEIHAHVEFKKRPEDQRQLGVGKTYQTDSKGRWRIDTVPANQPSVNVTVTHPEFMPTSTKLEADKYLLAKNAEPSATLTIDRGLTVSGLVSDTNGAPIPNALVRTKLRNETLEATTNDLGEYQLLRCAEGSTAIAVTATGFAPEFKDVNIQPNLPSLDFTLPPGKTIRVRVTDAEGRPIARTRMFFQRWRDKTDFDYALGNTHLYTDENGIWEWNSAPEDALKFDVCPPESMQIVGQWIVAGDEEYHYVATPLLTIIGAVLDAETREPIKEFRVTPGNRWPGRAEPFWHERDAFQGKNGSFETVIRRVDGTQLLTISAVGYAPVTSRDIQWDEGQLELEFALQKAPDVLISILRPDGAPAPGAEAAIAVGSTQIVVSDGKLNSSTYAERIISDAAGRLNLGARTEPIGLVIVDDSGYAEAFYDPEQPIVAPVTLVAWGQVEGNLMIADGMGADQEIVLNLDHQQEFGGLARLRHENKVMTNAAGDFKFTQVLPVSANIGINVITHASHRGHTTAMSHRRVINIQPGETTHIQLGGKGHTVKGKLLPPAIATEPVDWEFSRVTIKNAIGLSPPIPYPAELETGGQRADWFRKWRSTPAALPWLADAQAYELRQSASVRYMCGVESDGRFVIHDLPPGAYRFNFELDFPGKNFGPLMGKKMEFTFSIEADDHQRTIVDLGELQVQNPD